MKTTKGVTIALSALMIFGATDIVAQGGPEGRRPGFARGADPEAVMGLREQLELTDEQIAELDIIRQEWVETRSAHRAAMEEMRSQLRAGQIQRSEMMAFMEEMRTQAPEADEARRERIEAVLDEAQRERLQELRTRGAFMRGRASARRGGPEGWRHGRGATDRRGPGWDRGMRSGRGGMRPGRGMRGGRRPGG